MSKSPNSPNSKKQEQFTFNQSSNTINCNNSTNSNRNITNTTPNITTTTINNNNNNSNYQNYNPNVGQISQPITNSAATNNHHSPSMTNNDKKKSTKSPRDNFSDDDEGSPNMSSYNYYSNIIANLNPTSTNGSLNLTTQTNGNTSVGNNSNSIENAVQQHVDNHFFTFMAPTSASSQPSQSLLQQSHSTPQPSAFITAAANNGPNGVKPSKTMDNNSISEANSASNHIGNSKIFDNLDIINNNNNCNKDNQNLSASVSNLDTNQSPDGSVTSFKSDSIRASRKAKVEWCSTQLSMGNHHFIRFKFIFHFFNK